MGIFREAGQCDTDNVCGYALRILMIKLDRLSRNDKTEEAGFTLLELLIAFAILAVLLTLVAATFRTTLRSISTIETRSHIFHAGRVAFSMFNDELQSAVVSTPFQKSNFLGIPHVRQNLSLDRISFDSYNFRRYSGSPPGTGPVTFDWWVKDGLIFHRETPTLFGNVKPLEPPETVQFSQFELTSSIFPLSEAVKDFHLQYHNGSQWVNQWSSQGGGKLPRAVSIELTLRVPGGGDQKFSTFVGLPHGNQDVF